VNFLLLVEEECPKGEVVIKKLPPPTPSLKRRGARMGLLLRFFSVIFLILFLIVLSV